MSLPLNQQYQKGYIANFYGALLLMYHVNRFIIKKRVCLVYQLIGLNKRETDD